MISKGIDNWNGCLSTACQKNNKEMLILALMNGADDWNYTGFLGACKGGHLEMVQLIMKNKNVNEDTLNEGLEYACKKGYVNLVKFLITIGANNYNHGLISACIGGHKEII